jgi:AmmeMemoRadiSam system protein A
VAAPGGERESGPSPQQSSEPAEFSADERAWLIALAHQAIEAGLHKQRPEVSPLNAHLTGLRGAFTTLHLEGLLRGCVGFIAPLYPLYQTVVETAQAAAFGDTRFQPVSAAEAGHLQIEISVLSPMFPIRAEQVEVGRHGLLVSQHNHRGLLLPQVAAEHGWDRETFLSQTCVKAGLPPNAWQRGAKLKAFTAEIFGE